MIFVELLKRFIQNIDEFSEIFVQKHFTSSIFKDKKGYGFESVSSVKVRVLCQGGRGGSSSLIGQKCKMVDGKQSSDWRIIQDGNSACDWTDIPYKPLIEGN